MLESIDIFRKKYVDILEKLSSEEVISNIVLLKKLSKEEAKLKEIINLHDEYDKSTKDEEGLRLLRNDEEANEEFIFEINSELDSINERKIILSEKINNLLLPEEPNEDKNVFLEIRAAAGGDEAALFAADLFRMYSSFANSKNWKVEIITSHSTGLKGFKEIIFSIVGENVFRSLMFESGVHRVQRVPETESSGRIHTSTITVAVLPEAQDAEVEIKSDDLRFETFKASGHGGQNVQKNETAVRVVHIPSGIAVGCQDERSQLQNKERALKILRAKLFDIESKRVESEKAKQRKLQVGWGDRSEKIRTYNFPQNRITDHRIGLTLYNLQEIMNGSMDELISALRNKYNEERKKEIEFN